MSENNTDVAVIINKSVKVFSGMADVLKANVAKADAGEARGAQIEAEISAAGGQITPELDEKLKDYIIKSNTNKKWMNDNRAAGTQMMTELAKMFTSQEARIDVAKPGTFAYKFQQYRNTYATQRAKEQQERERMAREAAEKATEAIQLKARVHDQLSSYFNAHVLEKKSNMLAAFNATTLETIDALSERLNRHDPVYAMSHFTTFQHSISGRFHTSGQITDMVDNVAMFADFEEQYKKELSEQCQDLISKLPSKRTELQEAETARLAQIQADKEAAEAKNEEDRKSAEKRAEEAKEQAAKVAAEKAKREEEEAAELKRKSEEKEETDKANNQLNAQAETVNVLFQSESELQLSADAPESRAGYDIEIVSTAGWMLIFSFWFDKEGKSLPVAKVEKTTMLQMKTYCEKYAHKHGEKIESKFLEYKIVHKAVNRQEKK